MDETIKAQVDAFLALPKPERKAVYQTLPPEVRKAARTAVERNRGIVMRDSNGAPVFSKDETIRQIVRLKEKHDSYDGRKVILAARIAELKSNLEGMYGADALAEAENALEGNA